MRVREGELCRVFQPTDEPSIGRSLGDELLPVLEFRRDMIVGRKIVLSGLGNPMVVFVRMRVVSLELGRHCSPVGRRLYPCQPPLNSWARVLGGIATQKEVTSTLVALFVIMLYDPPIRASSGQLPSTHLKSEKVSWNSLAVLECELHELQCKRTVRLKPQHQGEAWQQISEHGGDALYYAFVGVIQRTAAN